MDRARFLLLGALFLGAASCDSQEGDPPAPSAVPPPAGKGHRIYEIADPNSPTKAKHESAVAVTGAVVVAVDQYDETHNGKSSGTIYVADLGSQEPYSGISLYNASFIPGNLRVTAGDALDLRGVFQENQDLPVLFAPGAFLVQIANAIGTFRFETNVTAPVELDDVAELADYAKGRKWLNMLVRVKNVRVARNLFAASGSGRVSADLSQEDAAPSTGTTTSGCEDPFPKPPTIVNELMDLEPLQIEKDAVLKSLTGVVTFFCNLHIAPRSAADIVR